MEPLRAVFEALGNRIVELEARARFAEERAARAEANCARLDHQVYEERKKSERLTAEADAAKNDYYSRRRSTDELEKRIGDAVDVLVEHPRSGAKALAILREDEVGPE